MHRLAAAPSHRWDTRIRLPIVQDARGATDRAFRASLMHPDALRRVKTTAKNRIALSPLATPQAFIRQPSGGVNTPGAMTGGTAKMNARRLVNKTPGQTAGA